MTHYPVLTVTTFLPAVGAVLILLMGNNRLARWIALATTIATLAVSAPLYLKFNKGPDADPLQFVDSAVWIPTVALGSHWTLTPRPLVWSLGRTRVSSTAQSSNCAGVPWMKTPTSWLSPA